MEQLTREEFLQARRQPRGELSPVERDARIAEHRKEAEEHRKQEEQFFQENSNACRRCKILLSDRRLSDYLRQQIEPLCVSCAETGREFVRAELAREKAHQQAKEKRVRQQELERERWHAQQRKKYEQQRKEQVRLGY